LIFSSTSFFLDSNNSCARLAIGGTREEKEVELGDEEEAGRVEEVEAGRMEEAEAEAGGRKQEAGGRKQEAGSRRQETGGRRQEAGGRRQEAGAGGGRQREDQAPGEGEVYLLLGLS
jgi:hypothetical protein